MSWVGLNQPFPVNRQIKKWFDLMLFFRLVAISYGCYNQAGQWPRPSHLVPSLSGPLLGIHVQKEYIASRYALYQPQHHLKMLLAVVIQFLSWLSSVSTTIVTNFAYFLATLIHPCNYARDPG